MVDAISGLQRTILRNKTDAGQPQRTPPLTALGYHQPVPADMSRMRSTSLVLDISAGTGTIQAKQLNLSVL